MKWSVVRARPRCPDQLLYLGGLKYLAERFYERESSEPGVIIKLYVHDGHGPRLLRKSDDVTVDTCSRCKSPIHSDWVAARDASSGHPVCEDCTRAERHLRRASL